MSHFSIAEREQIKQQITTIAQENENILAAVLVGSGAVGFADEVSDIDFVMVVDAEANILETMKCIKRRIEEYYDVLFFTQMDKRGLQIYLLNNYLEIDIGFQSLNNAEAKNECYKIIFDKNNTVAPVMRETCQQNKSKEQENISDENLKRKYMEESETIWHYVFHAAVAIKRNQYWHCLAELDIVRNKIIELKGYRNSIRTKRWRDVDKLPHNDLLVLQKTYTTALTQKSLLQSLLLLTNLLFDELEAIIKNEIAVNRQHTLNYISDVIKV